MTGMDRIANLLGEVIASADPALCEELYAEMTTYEETYGRTLRDLRRVPGFRKLWDQMIVATDERLEAAGPISHREADELGCKGI